MRLRRITTRSRIWALVLLPALAVATTACMGYPADGNVLTPGSPSQTASSRLPSLLQQLQGNGGAGLEVFDGSENQVLAAQDAQGKSVPVASPSPTATDTVAGTSTARPATPTPTPRSASAQTAPPAATPTGAATSTATAASSATPTSAPTTTTTATPTATRVTPTATPVSEAPHSETPGASSRTE